MCNTFSICTSKPIYIPCVISNLLIEEIFLNSTNITVSNNSDFLCCTSCTGICIVTRNYLFLLKFSRCFYAYSFMWCWLWSLVLLGFILMLEFIMMLRLVCILMLAIFILNFNSLSANPTNWSNTLKTIRRLMYLTLSWRRPLSYRNKSIALLRKSMDWFLYDNRLRHDRVKGLKSLSLSFLWK